MKPKLCATLFLFVSFIQISLAADKPATEASIKRLMEVTEAKAMMAGMMSQMDAYLQQMMKQAAGGKAPTPEQEAVLADMRKKLVAVMEDETRWDKLEPGFIEIYRKSLSEKEVQGMVDFYVSPSGQAVIRKMPLVMQHSMEMMQQLILGMMPKLKKIEEDTARELEQCCKRGS